MGNAKFMQAIVDNCGGQGMMPPITVCAVSRDGSLFCLRVRGEEDGAELLCSHPEDHGDPQLELPIIVFVVDATGRAGHGRVDVDDPDRLVAH